MKPYYKDQYCTLYHGDCRQVLLDVFDLEHFDYVITDPPYELGFMSKKWDKSGVSFSPLTWEIILSVCKPGAGLLSFGGTRTVHRIACAIEDGGWQIRDMLTWLYGCLDEETEILTDDGWKPYHKTMLKQHVLCYDLEYEEFSWQSIEDRIVHDYEDTAFRVIGNRVEQLLSRGHRCVVKQDGAWVLRTVEEAASQYEVCVPVLEDLQDLLDSISLPHKRTGDKKADLFKEVYKEGSSDSKNREIQSSFCILRYLWERISSAAKKGKKTAKILLKKVLGFNESRSYEEHTKNDVRIEQPGVERGSKKSKAYIQVCSLPFRIYEYGASRWLGKRGSFSSGSDSRKMSHQKRSSASRRQEQKKQSAHKSCSVQVQRGSSEIRTGNRYIQSDMVRVERVKYKGVMWCVRVSTGVFVARRKGGTPFLTGNSGMPKGHDISKAIDRMLGAERQVVGRAEGRGSNAGSDCYNWNNPNDKVDRTVYDVTVPATDEAAEWEGWNVSLKPSFEPVVYAQKPVEGTYAQNALEHGVVGINVDAGRIKTKGERNPSIDRRQSARVNDNAPVHKRSAKEAYADGKIELRGSVEAYTTHKQSEELGRWPPNVMLSHHEECRQVGKKKSKKHSKDTMTPTTHDAPAKFGYSPERHQFNYEGEDTEVWDCHPECPVRLLDEQSGVLTSGRSTEKHEGYVGVSNTGLIRGYSSPDNQHGGTGGASRFMYCSKASQADRGYGNLHPTVKPQKIMEWLIKLFSTPTGGLLLDPFAGSGTTLVVAKKMKRHIVGIELDKESCDIIVDRLSDFECPNGCGNSERFCACGDKDNEDFNKLLYG